MLKADCSIVITIDVSLYVEEIHLHVVIKKKLVINEKINKKTYIRHRDFIIIISVEKHPLLNIGLAQQFLRLPI